MKVRESSIRATFWGRDLRLKNPVNSPSPQLEVDVETDPSVSEPEALEEEDRERISGAFPRAKRPRRFSSFLKLVALLLILVVGIAMAVSQTEWGEAKVSELAREAIASELGLEAEFGDLEIGYAFIPPSVLIDATEIELRHPEHGRLASAQALRLGPAITPLLWGELDLRRIELESPEIELIIRDGQILNLPTIESSGSSETPSLPFSSLVVTDANVLVDANPEVEAELRGLDLSVDVANGTVLSIELDCRDGIARHVGGEDTLQRLLFEGEVDLAEEVVDADRIAIRGPNVRVLATDALFSFDIAQGYQGDLDLRVDLDQLERLPVSVELPEFTGQVLFEGHVEGMGEEPEATGTVRLREVTIAGQWGLGDEIALQVVANRERIEIQEGSLATLRHGGTLGLEASLELDPDRGFPLEVRGDVNDLNLGKLLSQLGVTDNAIVDWPMTGRLGLNGTLEPLMLEGPIRFVTRNFLVSLQPWHASNRTRVVGVERGEITTRWRIDPESVSFFDGELNTPRSRVRVPHVHLGFDNRVVVDANGSIDLTDISPLVGFDLEGQAEANVTVRGEFNEPVVGGDMSIREFVFENFRLGDMEGDFYIRDDHNAVVFPTLRAIKNTSEYRVDDLTLDFAQEGVQVSAHLRTSRLNLQDVYHVFGFEEDERYTPYQGVGRGHMAIQFSYAAPGDGPFGTLNSQIEFEFLQAVLAEQRFDGGRFLGNLTWYDFTQGMDAAVLDIDEFILRKEGGTISVEGQIAPQGGGRLGDASPRLSVRADRIAIPSIQGVGERMPSLGGVVSVIGRVEGTLNVPHMHLDVSYTGLHWDDIPIGDGRTYVRLTDVTDPWVREARNWDINNIPEGEVCGHARFGLANGRWRPAPPLQTVDGPLRSLDRRMAFLVCGDGMHGQLGIDLAMGWTDVYPLRGVIDFNDLDAASMLARVAPTLDVQGAINGRVALNSGAMLQDGTLGGWVHLEPLGLSIEGPGGDAVPLRSDGPLAIDIERGGFEFRRARFLGGAGSELALTGGGDAMGRLNMSADGNLDLSLVPSVSEMVEDAEGSLALHVDVRGTLDDPTVFGNAQLSDAAMRLSGLPVALEELSAEIRFDDHRLELASLDARMAEGRLSALGAARVEQGSLADVAIEVGLRGAQFRPDEGILVGASADLGISWQPDAGLPLVSGQVFIDRALYERNTSLSPTLGELYRPSREDVQRYDPEGDQLALDIEIVDRAPIRVRNNLADMDIAIDDDESLRLVGTNQRYGLIGALSIPRGMVRFRNTEFTVQRGEIRFADETRIAPSFDVLASTEIRRQQTSADLTAQAWRVQLRAHGDMDAFRLDATSQPQLSQEDLMLLLTVGMTTIEAQQLRAGDVGGTALEALSAISGVNDEVRDALQVIDDFAITTRYSPATGRPEPMVTIGKRITDRVRLSAATGLTGEERTVQAGVEVQVGDRTTLQLLYDNINRESSSSIGNIGADLEWRIEFD